MTTTNTPEYASQVEQALDRVGVAVLDTTTTPDTITLVLDDLGGSTTLNWHWTTGWPWTHTSTDGAAEDGDTLPGLSTDASGDQVAQAVVDDLGLVNVADRRDLLHGIADILAPLLRS